MKHVILSLLLILIAAPLWAQTTSVPFNYDITDDSASVTCTWARVTGDVSDVIAVPTKTFAGTAGTPWTQSASTTGTFSVNGPREYRLSCNDGVVRPAVSVKFDVLINKAPTIKITSPAAGAVIAFNRSTIIEAEAENAEYAELRIDGESIISVNGSGLKYDWRPGPAKRGKSVNLEVMAESATGKQSASAVSVKVK